MHSLSQAEEVRALSTKVAAAASEPLKEQVKRGVEELRKVKLNGLSVKYATGPVLISGPAQLRTTAMTVPVTSTNTNRDVRAIKSWMVSNGKLLRSVSKPGDIASLESAPAPWLQWPLSVPNCVGEHLRHVHSASKRYGRRELIANSSETCGRKLSLER